VFSFPEGVKKRSEGKGPKNARLWKLKFTAIIAV
jgi:hypothetical protein